MTKLFKVKVQTLSDVTIVTFTVGVNLSPDDAERYYDLANRGDRAQLAEDIESTINETLAR